MRSKACLRCNEYVDIDPSNFKNKDILKRFEKDHLNHLMVTVDHTEIEERCKDVHSLYMAM